MNAVITKSRDAFCVWKATAAKTQISAAWRRSWTVSTRETIWKAPSGVLFPLVGGVLRGEEEGRLVVVEVGADDVAGGLEVEVGPRRHGVPRFRLPGSRGDAF